MLNAECRAGTSLDPSFPIVFRNCRLRQWKRFCRPFFRLSHLLDGESKKSEERGLTGRRHGAIRPLLRSEGRNESNGVYPIPSFFSEARSSARKLLFEIVNTEGMRRRRRAEFDTSNASASDTRDGVTRHQKWCQTCASDLTLRLRCFGFGRDIDQST